MTNYLYEPASPQLLARWHYMMKLSMAKANDADRRMSERRNINYAYCESRGFTPEQRVSYMTGDLEFRTYQDDFSFYSAEVHRFGAMIQAELAMQTLMQGK